VKRSPLRRRSKKRASATYRGARALAVNEAIERDRHCKALDLIPGHVCRGGLVGHEPVKRSAGGDPLNPEEVVAVCEGFNSDVESDADLAKVAREVGLVKSMGSRYANGRLVRR
jgi:hypothetical protein